MSTQILQAAQTRELVSYDPATGEEVGRAPLRTPAEVEQAVRRARTAQPSWASLSFRDRARVILKAREIMLSEMDQIASLISRETGKPVSEALAMELVPTLDAMQYFARKSEALLRQQKIDIGQHGLMCRESRLVFKPHGVVGIISP